MRRILRGVLGFALVAGVLGYTRPACAAAGALDPTFGKGGIARGPASQFLDASLQPDGRLVAVGLGPASGSDVSTSFAIVRLRSDGTPDASFGDAGVVYRACPSCIGAWTAVALEGDGKILVAGIARSFDDSGPELALAPPQARIARYRRDGTLDAGFAVASVFEQPASPLGVLVQPEGKSLVSAVTAADSRLHLVRLDRNGRIDPSYGDGGTAALDLFFTPGRLVEQPDGKVLTLAQSTREDPNHVAPVMARVLPDGHLDPTFGIDGLADLWQLDAGVVATDLALFSDGSIVVARSTGDQVFLERYDETGHNDRTFGALGQARFVATGGSEVSLLAQPYGAVAVLAVERQPSGGDWVVARFDRRGMPDLGFGEGFEVRTELAVGGEDPGDPARLLEAPGGKLLAVGSTEDGLAAVRYLGDPTPLCREPLSRRPSDIPTLQNDARNRDCQVAPGGPAVHLRRVPSAAGGG